MSKPSHYRVAAAYLGLDPGYRTKTAGEVRFIKDRGGDKNEWGWGSPGPSEREITESFVFNAKYLKPLACTLRSALMALGHATSAHARFVKIKSRNISPDGALGGKGYIAKIPDMRRQLMNVIEALSAFTDTVYDEIEAAHWNKVEDTLSPRDRQDVQQIVQDVKEIKDDPEGWAEEAEDEMDDEGSKDEFTQKMASTDRVAVFDRALRVEMNHIRDLLTNIERMIAHFRIHTDGIGRRSIEHPENIEAWRDEAEQMRELASEVSLAALRAVKLSGRMGHNVVRYTDTPPVLREARRQEITQRVALRYMEIP